MQGVRPVTETRLLFRRGHQIKNPQVQTGGSLDMAKESLTLGGGQPPVMPPQKTDLATPIMDRRNTDRRKPNKDRWGILVKDPGINGVH